MIAQEALQIQLTASMLSMVRSPSLIQGLMVLSSGSTQVGSNMQQIASLKLSFFNISSLYMRRNYSPSLHCLQHDSHMSISNRYKLLYRLPTICGDWQFEQGIGSAGSGVGIQDFCSFKKNDLIIDVKGVISTHQSSSRNTGYFLGLLFVSFYLCCSTEFTLIFLLLFLSSTT